MTQSIKCTVQQQQRGGGSFRYCTSSLYHLNLSPFYSTLLQAVYGYKVMYSVIKCVFSALIEFALLRGLEQSSLFSKGSFHPLGVLVNQLAWLAPARCTGSDRTQFHWDAKNSYQVLLWSFTILGVPPPPLAKFQKYGNFLIFQEIFHIFKKNLK